MNAKRAIVLIVDEASDNLIQMNSLLQDRYEVRLANSGRAALMVMEHVPRPDLVVLDDLGHINAAADLGRWSEGQALLDRLLEGDIGRRATTLAPLVQVPLPKIFTTTE